MPLGVVALSADAVLKGTVLLGVAFMLARVLLNAPAAARHLVWSVALVGVLGIPALSRTIPWKLELLPAIEFAALAEAPSSDLATNAHGAEAFGGGVPVAGAADTDQARIPLRGSLETEGARRATTGRSWQLPTAPFLGTADMASRCGGVIGTDRDQLRGDPMDGLAGGLGGSGRLEW